MLFCLLLSILFLQTFQILMKNCQCDAIHNAPTIKYMARLGKLACFSFPGRETKKETCTSVTVQRSKIKIYRRLGTYLGSVLLVSKSFGSPSNRQNNRKKLLNVKTAHSILPLISNIQEIKFSSPVQYFILTLHF